MSAHDFEFVSIDGEPLPLRRFSGKPVLVVNTASECGFTPQYAGLQKLWESYGPRGLVVIGVPSNDFGEQEPGSESEIKAFCSQNYGVGFPLTGKEKVVGREAHPFFKWIAEEFGEAAIPQWNFHKYLVDPDGELHELWPSRVEPLAPEITSVIEELLPE